MSYLGRVGCVRRSAPRMLGARGDLSKELIIDSDKQKRGDMLIKKEKKASIGLT